ncbi:exodeoxyribonuclease I subunit D [Anaerobacterium chartisolvens]|uniref:Nuclease SbcCD subunit D n=1 Tax=Anaerobacterium chartisolvens TaxID=1297424 RepID=A0A369AKK2_9FIRM|nr:exonuclease SbcCD subunit D [Anaerobacterium chartisolvens]RCX09892.1 exodeoxyribonuclease I subunit D [Anaerobacterium chartisolvens]
MRILHTSDWHLGKMLDNISRIQEQREFSDCLCDIAEKESIDLVLVAGDIYDTYNPSAAAEELFYRTVDRLSAGGRRAVVVIAGNHDNPERLCAAAPMAYKNGIILLGYPASDAGIYKWDGGGIRVVRSGPGWLQVSIDGCDEDAVIIALAYPSESRLDQVLSDEANESRLQKAYSDRIGGLISLLSKNFREDTVNVVMGHMFLRGGKESESERTLQIGGALTVDPAVLPPKAHFAAMGHLHRPQRIKDAPCPAFYSGSPLAYSFSEAGYSKVVYVVDAVPGRQADIKEVLLSCGKPLKKWEARNGIEQALAWCEEGRDANAWIDVDIYTDRVLATEEQKRLRELNPGIINIRPVIKTKELEVQSLENREGKKIDELFADYCRFKTGMEISEELAAAFLEVINDEQDDEGGGGERLETKIS